VRQAVGSACERLKITGTIIFDNLYVSLRNALRFSQCVIICLRGPVGKLESRHSEPFDELGMNCAKNLAFWALMTQFEIRRRGAAALLTHTVPKRCPPFGPRACRGETAFGRMTCTWILHTHSNSEMSGTTQDR